MQIVSSQVPPPLHFQCCLFITGVRNKKKGKREKLPDIYAIHGIENEERGRETERVHIACGGHYFWCAPRLGELENIILSGWFDSAMKNVRSGDDKSWCWGEETGRQGMSFVMSAIWLHPLSTPPPFPSASSSTSHPFLCVSTSSSLTSVVCPSLFFFFSIETQFLLFFFFHPLMRNYFTFTGSSAVTPTLPNFHSFLTQRTWRKGRDLFK